MEKDNRTAEQRELEAGPRPGADNYIVYDYRLNDCAADNKLETYPPARAHQNGRDVCEAIAPAIAARFRRHFWSPMNPEAQGYLNAIVTSLARDPSPLDDLAEWVMAFPNVVFRGPIGTGKSVGAAQLLWRIHQLNGRLVESGHILTAHRSLRTTWCDWPLYAQDHFDRTTDVTLTASLMTHHWVVLDDIGLVSGGPAAVAASRGLLYALVNHRHNNGYPTIVTLNETGEEGTARTPIGERVRSRLFGGAVTITMDGEDRRFGA